ncbi:MAG: hypothetical protein PHF86_00930 [Candidatus Nanoarchaeia archaeon]|nr:hypothetical protein [Candidatus Nanoarchaeia archaeon]
MENNNKEKIKLILSILKDSDKRDKFLCIEGISGEVCDDCPIASLNHKFGQICEREEYSE